MIGLESMTEANPNESSTAIFDWANKFHKAFRELKYKLKHSLKDLIKDMLDSDISILKNK